MYQEITQFTYRHYASDLKHFFTWVNKLPNAITITDVDNYITYAQAKGHAIATINQRLTALSAFY